MQYPELAALDTTLDDDLALAIELKSIGSDLTPGAYLAERVRRHILDDLVAQRISRVQTARVLDTFEKATPQEKAAVAAALKIDLTVDVPADVAVAEVIL